MSDKTVLFEVKNSVGYLTLNRPDKHNSFNGRVVSRLNELFQRIEDREELVAVVLRGKGKSFSAGADLNWMKEAARSSEEENREDALSLARMLQALYTLPPVTLACVQGAALGGGMGLVACCDIAIAHSEAAFGFSEVRLGLIPATISPYVLAAIGPGQARRYFQTGERFSGVKAHEIGLVHELVEGRSEQKEVLTDLLNSIQKNGPESMKRAKKLCLDLAYRPITEEILTETARRIAEIRSGEEAREGIQAFLNDCSPSWTQDTNR